MPSVHISMSGEALGPEMASHAQFHPRFNWNPPNTCVPLLPPSPFLGFLSCTTFSLSLCGSLSQWLHLLPFQPVASVVAVPSPSLGLLASFVLSLGPWEGRWMEVRLALSKVMHFLGSLRVRNTDVSMESLLRLLVGAFLLQN